MKTGQPVSMTNTASHYFGEKRKKNWSGNKSNVILQFQVVTVPNIFIFNELLTLHEHMSAVIPRGGGDVFLQPAVLCRTFHGLWLRGGSLLGTCLSWGNSVAAVLEGRMLSSRNGEV